MARPKARSYGTVYAGGRGPERRSKPKMDSHTDSLWRCSHCGCGVRMKNDGSAGSHNIDGRRGPNAIPCLGSGQDCVEVSDPDDTVTP